MCAQKNRKKVVSFLKEANAELSEDQINTLVDAQYALAEIIFERWKEAQS
jgi:hypothetical protein